MKITALIMVNWKSQFGKIEEALLGIIPYLTHNIDTTYGGKEIFDIITENNLIEIFKEPHISIIINGIWNGGIDTESFLNYSINYNII